MGMDGNCIDHSHVTFWVLFTNTFGCYIPGESPPKNPHKWKFLHLVPQITWNVVRRKFSEVEICRSGSPPPSTWKSRKSGDFFDDSWVEQNAGMKRQYPNYNPERPTNMKIIKEDNLSCQNIPERNLPLSQSGAHLLTIPTV